MNLDNVFQLRCNKLKLIYPDSVHADVILSVQNEELVVFFRIGHTMAPQRSNWITPQDTESAHLSGHQSNIGCVASPPPPHVTGEG